ncbi:helix-turn-helix domain-containing protein [Clostridium grantii]|uniref:Helix-turn-helix domain-containing protein n=1 Tax=Clostridium grantii DSM 8605 TaxID=1121316 RepID=A0A1M5SE74_9CLOT|nr:helix-turn-helix domain-containing protein [Clostridium grantii]SHH36769.1 Helix-turn-helix domain-containing protein [Clostridium grantii DSM 8605]
MRTKKMKNIVNNNTSTTTAGNYTIIQNADITSNLSNSAYRLYVLLLSMCYADKDTCYPSQQYLASKLHCSVRTIQRSLKELIVDKLIKKQRRGSISNIYTMLQKKINQVGNTVANKVNQIKNNYSSNKSNQYKDSFSNRKQRSYNLDKIERTLLGWDEYE